MNQGPIEFLGTNHHHFMHTVSGISARDWAVWRGTGSAADSAAPRQESLYLLRSTSAVSVTWPEHPDSADHPVHQSSEKTVRQCSVHRRCSAAPMRASCSA